MDWKFAKALHALVIVLLIIIFCSTTAHATFHQFYYNNYVWDDETGLVWFQNYGNIRKQVGPNYDHPYSNPYDVYQNPSLLESLTPEVYDVNGDNYIDTLSWRLAWSHEVFEFFQQDEDDELTNMQAPITSVGVIYGSEGQFYDGIKYDPYILINIPSKRGNYLDIDPLTAEQVSAANWAHVGYMIVADVTFGGTTQPPGVPEPTTVLITRS